MSGPTAVDVLVSTLIGVLLGGLLSAWVATKTSRRSEAAALAAEERMLERDRAHLASQVSAWVDLDTSPRYFVLNRTNSAVHAFVLDLTLLAGNSIDDTRILDALKVHVEAVPPIGDPIEGPLPASWLRTGGVSIAHWTCLISASFHDTHGDQWTIGEDGVAYRGTTAEEVERIALAAFEEAISTEEE